MEKTDALAWLEGILFVKHCPSDVQLELESDCSMVIEKINS
jgi:hypothetical protein